jgi:hypothetical protein
MYSIQIYYMNNTLTYKLKLILKFYHYGIATEYYKIFNNRINKDASKYITHCINTYCQMTQLNDCIVNKDQYAINCNLVTNNNIKILLNVSVISNKNVDVISAEYINSLNNFKIMIKLISYNSYNIENLLYI